MAAIDSSVVVPMVIILVTPAALAASIADTPTSWKEMWQWLSAHMILVAQRPLTW